MKGLGIRGDMYSSLLPSGLDWSFKFEPSVAIQAAGLRRFSNNLDDLREPLTQAVKQVMQPSIRKNFNSGGRPAWEPLSEDTVKKKGGDRRILIDSGNLRFVASMFSIWTITESSATIRDLPQMVWYGKVHQTGAKKAARADGKGYVNIPQRQFIMFQPQDEVEIERIFAKWIAKRAKVDVR